MKTVHHSEWDLTRGGQCVIRLFLLVGISVLCICQGRLASPMHNTGGKCWMTDKETVQRICGHIIHARNIRQSYHYAQTQADYPSI